LTGAARRCDCQGALDTFPWYDPGTLRLLNPLGIVARILVLADYLEEDAREASGYQGGGEGAGHKGWLIYGLASTARSLAEAGRLDDLGVLLTALETLVPEDIRVGWPLTDAAEEVIEGLGAGSEESTDEDETTEGQNGHQ